MELVKLFVSNLAPGVTNSDLLNILPGKHVQKAFIAVNKEKESRGFGFISVAKEDVPAFLNLDTMMFKGRPVVVNHAVEKDEKDNTIKYFIRNLSYTATKADLRNFFTGQNIIPINVVVVQKPDEETGEIKSRGFGFVLVYKKDEARLKSLDGQKLKGRPICLLPYKEQPKRERN